MPLPPPKRPGVLLRVPPATSHDDAAQFQGMLTDDPLPKRVAIFELTCQDFEDRDVGRAFGCQGPEPQPSHGLNRTCRSLLLKKERFRSGEDPGMGASATSL